ncbi:MAG: hypothetical protein KF901_18420 [Myxococcales bacterium]|nr:hypothetical protein [Myxococcales bacterium]
MPIRWILLVVVSLVLLACGQLRDDLQRARAAYDIAKYEDAQVWLEAIEPEIGQLESYDRVRFYYLRGMTAERLGQRADALHYLSLANEGVQVAGARAGLTDEQRRTLEATLPTLVPTGRDHRPPSSDEVPSPAAPDGA